MRLLWYLIIPCFLLLLHLISLMLLKGANLFNKMHYLELLDVFGRILKS